MRLIGDFLFLILFFMLIGVWLVMWIGLHIAGGVIHLLLLIAVISLIMHLLRGPGGVTAARRPSRFSGRRIHRQDCRHDSSASDDLSGTVRHMEVINVDHGKTLVLTGMLGPLQSLAATGTMTIQLATAADGTKLCGRVRGDRLPAERHEHLGPRRWIPCLPSNSRV